MCADRTNAVQARDCEIAAGAVSLPGTLALPSNAAAIVAFAHGSGSSRLSPRNVLVAEALQDARFGTLLFDLLTAEEAQDRRLVFDVPLLGERLLAATDWIRSQHELDGLPLGYFGASTGAAAALWAAAELGGAVAAVVSRGGRPDLATARLPQVTASVLLIVGGEDVVVLDLNREAQAQLRAPSELVVVPGATHLFEEPGALEAVCEHAIDWFARHSAGRGKA